MKLGDTVIWTSQAQGYVKRKIGVIVDVVPAGKRPDREKFLALYRGPGVGMPRDHESYVVRCRPKDNNGRGGLYWPRANQLKTY